MCQEVAGRERRRNWKAKEREKEIINREIACNKMVMIEGKERRGGGGEK